MSTMMLLAVRVGAIDFYEIQIYPTGTTPSGILSLELHSNSVTTATGFEAHAQLNPYQIHSRSIIEAERHFRKVAGYRATPRRISFHNCEPYLKLSYR
jgi:hypothetical protein